MKKILRSTKYKTLHIIISHTIKIHLKLNPYSLTTISQVQLKRKTLDFVPKHFHLTKTCKIKMSSKVWYTE